MAPSPTANELSCQPTAPKQKACEKALPIPAAGGNAGISLKQHCLQAKSNPVSLPVAVGLPDQALPAEGSPVSRKRRRGAEPPAVSEVFPGGDYPAISPLWGAEVAEAVWRRFHEAYSGSAQKHVVAGMVLVERNGCTAPSPRVVAIGSGNKSLKGDQLSLEGQKVQDCHAEVVARRSLLRWLYAQVEAAMRPMPGGSSSPTSVGSAVVPSPPGSAWPYRLRPGTELWLYISCAPCGDAAIFSRADQEGQANRGDGANAAEGLGLHFAMWPGTKNVGLLRSKVEAGAGSIPVKDGEEVEPGIDGVNRGQRVRRHSCSDKIAKWAVVGLQGSLLSRLLEPVYLRGVVVGDLFSAPHLHRALCCRSQRALLGSTLPAPFCLHHLQAVRGQPCDTRRHEAVMTCKRATADSVNWAEGDPKEGELLDATTGAVKTDPSKGRPGAPSRISKAALFASYCRLAPGASALTYSENKLKAEAYHCAKSKWTEAMKGAGFGCWLRRPSDADDFRL